MVASQTWKNRRNHRGVFQVNTSWGVGPVFSAGFLGVQTPNLRCLKVFGDLRVTTNIASCKNDGKYLWLQLLQRVEKNYVPCYFVQQQVNKQLTRRAEILLGSFSKTELILFKAKSQYFYLCNPEIMGNFKGGRPNATFREIGLYSSKGLLYHHDCPFIIS